LFDDDNNPAGVSCLGIDVTRYETQTQVLENVIQELNDKKQRLGQIAFLQSHVVRRPLANLLGLTNIIAQINIDDEQLKQVTALMLDSAKQLDTVISQTLHNVS
jgi:signal transduction histidine kinase